MTEDRESQKIPSRTMIKNLTRIKNNAFLHPHEITIEVSILAITTLLIYHSQTSQPETDASLRLLGTTSDNTTESTNSGQTTAGMSAVSTANSTAVSRTGDTVTSSSAVTVSSSLGKDKMVLSVIT
jgi:hypothetical protein